MKIPSALLVASAILTAGFVGSASAQGRRGAPANALAHKQMMDEAGNARDDLGEALADKDLDVSAEMSGMIEQFMVQTEAYWAARKMADIVKLAQTARGQAKDLTAAAKAGRLVAAQIAFQNMNTTCNTCHDLHPEKR
jgi:hypothetical protein